MSKFCMENGKRWERVDGRVRNEKRARGRSREGKGGNRCKNMSVLRGFTEGREMYCFEKGGKKDVVTRKKKTEKRNR